MYCLCRGGKRNEPWQLAVNDAQGVNEGKLVDSNVFRESGIVHDGTNPEVSEQ